MSRQCIRRWKKCLFIHQNSVTAIPDCVPRPELRTSSDLVLPNWQLDLSHSARARPFRILRATAPVNAGEDFLTQALTNREQAVSWLGEQTAFVDAVFIGVIPLPAA